MVDNSKLFNQTEYDLAKCNENIHVTCTFCDKVSLQRKTNVMQSLRNNLPLACKRQKGILPCGIKALIKERRVNVKCTKCSKSLVRLKSMQKYSKLPFCSASCSTSFYNRFGSRRSSPRSKAEKLFVSLLKSDFSNLVCLENCRSAIPSGLELDIYIPMWKTAIEINGPTHYFPIYGQPSLKQTKHNDSIKQQECKNLGIDLHIIDISLVNFDKRGKAWIQQQYQAFKDKIGGKQWTRTTHPLRVP